MIMCSFDVSTKKTGFAVFEDGVYCTSNLLDHDDMKDLDARTKKMAIDILQHLNMYNPSIVSIEDTYCGGNAATMKKLTRLQGVILGWCVEHDSDFNIYMPTSWRKEFGTLFNGKKREECKKIAVEYVKEKYDLDVNDDEAEAILIGESTVKKVENCIRMK